MTFVDGSFGAITWRLCVIRPPTPPCDNQLFLQQAVLLVTPLAQPVLRQTVLVDGGCPCHILNCCTCSPAGLVQSQAKAWEPSESILQKQLCCCVSVVYCSLSTADRIEALGKPASAERTPKAPTPFPELDEEQLNDPSSN